MNKEELIQKEIQITVRKNSGQKIDTIRLYNVTMDDNDIDNFIKTNYPQYKNYKRTITTITRHK